MLLFSHQEHRERRPRAPGGAPDRGDQSHAELQSGEWEAQLFPSGSVMVAAPPAPGSRWHAWPASRYPQPIAHMTDPSQHIFPLPPPLCTFPFCRRDKGLGHPQQCSGIAPVAVPGIGLESAKCRMSPSPLYHPPALSILSHSVLSVALRHFPAKVVEHPPSTEFWS